MPTTDTIMVDAERLAVIVTSDVVGGHEMQLVHLAHTVARGRPLILIATVPSVARFFADQGFDVRLAPFVRPGKLPQQWLAGPSLARILRPMLVDCDASLVSGGTIEACVAPARALKIITPNRPTTAYIPMYVDRAVQYGRIGAAYNCASRLFIGSIDSFITINRIQARLIRRHYRRPVRVICNQISPIRLSGENHGPRLVYIGRLEDQQKNVSGLLTLLDHADNPFRSLHIFGDGPDRSAIEARAATLRHLTVQFYGWVSHTELANKLGRRDVLVMNSRWEGEPMIVREVAAAGIVAVATDIPGFRGIVRRQNRFSDQNGLISILRRLHVELRAKGTAA